MVLIKVLNMRLRLTTEMTDGATNDTATGRDGSAPFGPANGSALVAEIERLRKRNSELQRRCQQAEAAVIKFKREWDKHGGPRGGSFGRALLACYCEDLERKLEAQNH